MSAQAAGIIDEQLGQWIKGARHRLGCAGIDSARLDARLLAGHVLEWGAAKVLSYPEYALSKHQREQLEILLQRRERRESLAAITGVKEFWGLEFCVTGDTLVPRPDSETLIEAALGAVADKQRSLRILDLGTGTGCLLLSLLSEFPNAWGLGVDVSEAALLVAAKNASRLGLAGRAEFVISDWGAAIASRFDLVVCNPPYISDEEFAALEDEVSRFEPRLALAGGADGLDCYRALAPRLSPLLAPGASVFIEVGATQATAVSALLSDQDIEIIGVLNDLSGRARVLEGQQSL